MKGFVLTNSSEHNHPSSRDQLTAENIERKWINAATSSVSNRELTAEIEVKCVLNIMAFEEFLKILYFRTFYILCSKIVF